MSPSKELQTMVHYETSRRSARPGPWIGLVLIVLLLVQPALAAERIPGQVRVKFQPAAAAALSPDAFRGPGKELTGLAEFDAASRELGVTGIRSRTHPVANASLDVRIGLSRWYTLTLPKDADLDRALARLAASPAVESAVPVYREENFAVPNDSLYSINWGLNNTGQFLSGTGCSPNPSHTCGTPVGTAGFDGRLQAAWNFPQGYGDPGVVIAILDGTGVDVDHPDLRIVPGWDFTDDDSDPDAPTTADTHGTGCAGIAAAIDNNGLGAAGVAGGCSIMPLRANGTDEMADALVWAADHGADVLSMSFGYPGVSTQKDLEDAMEYAYLSGVTMLGATGNSNFFTLSLPASHHGVIGVGAASPCGSRKRGDDDPLGRTCDNEAWTSNYSSTALQDAPDAVDILAPSMLPSLNLVGNGDTSDGGSADYRWSFNGTSCAAPFAAGVAALIKSRWPDWSPDQVRERLVSTATDVVDTEAGAGWDPFSGYGLVNAAAALSPVATRMVGGAYATIQAAIDASNDFDTIVVPPGTYPEVIDFLGKQVTVESQGGPDVTVIDGTGLGESVVTMASGETPASILRGFTITGGVGHLTGGGIRRGGGLRMASGSGTVESCVFRGNAADQGGAICLQSSAGAIRSCRVGTPGSGNAATSLGGGIALLFAPTNGSEAHVVDTIVQNNVADVDAAGGLYIQGTAARIVGCEFLGNSTGGGGGGIYTSSNAVLDVVSSRFAGNEALGNAGGAALCSTGDRVAFWACEFDGNTAATTGGAIESGADSVSIYSSLFTGNAAANRGGAIRVSSGSTLRVVHGTFVGNTCASTDPTRGGGGLLVQGRAEVENSILWHNTTANGDDTESSQVKSDGGVLVLTSTCVEGLAALVGTDLLGDDPLFVDEAGGDLRLQAISPLREIGTGAAAADLDDLDLDGNARDWGCGPDLGAYEYATTGNLEVPGDLRTIQCALETAVDGDVITVAPGTWSESLDFLGKDVTLVSAAGPNVTILDGTGLTSRLVTMASGESEASVLRGFTLRNAAPTDANGGALRVVDGAGTIDRCRFVNCATTYGGALQVQNGRVAVSDCEFTGNTATSDGGAVHVSGLPTDGTTTSVLQRVTFTGNSTAGSGGALRIIGGDVLVTGGTFTGNAAGAAGGAIQVNDASQLTVLRCDFEGNAAANNGGALRCSASAEVFVASSRFFANVANADSTGDSGGGAVQLESAADVTMAYCTLATNRADGAPATRYGGGIEVTAGTLAVYDSILWGNTSDASPSVEGEQIRNAGTTSVSHTIVQGLSTFAGNSNSFGAPQFVDGPGGDLRLTAGSPAIDTGGNAWSIFGITQDLDGGDRAIGGVADRGAYEFNALSGAPDTPMPRAYALRGAAPNPFNPQTEIAFEVPTRGQVVLRVYDVKGRIVRTLLSESLEAGVHTVPWNGRDDGGRAVASGVYFVKMTAPGFGGTAKVMLLK
ncbi:MAG TPA: S8 family serine peptidase [Candidatus Krumholzibacteria bacterium]|nr:S8 family serine peptidase [Candidatus Krumholzibacteria bacterium]